MRQFWNKHHQTIVNWIVFLAIGRWVVVYAIDKYNAGILWDFVEIAFLAHMAIMLVYLLVRRPHVAVDRSYLHQLIALAAFFSGIWYQDQVADAAWLQWAARAVTILAIVLGMATQVNLGRSFGILIAYRQVKTDWLYSIIRHPMYLTDILFKAGMVLRKPTWINLAITAAAVGIYVYRAILEERFLSQFPQYQEYMKKVRFRFVPGIF